MKRASYRSAVKWIADNDEPTDTDIGTIADYISTLLTADLFEVTPKRVAQDVLKHRKKEMYDEW